MRRLISAAIMAVGIAMTPNIANACWDQSYGECAERDAIYQNGFSRLNLPSGTVVYGGRSDNSYYELYGRDNLKIQNGYVQVNVDFGNNKAEFAAFGKVGASNVRTVNAAGLDFNPYAGYYYGEDGTTTVYGRVANSSSDAEGTSGVFWQENGQYGGFVAKKAFETDLDLSGAGDSWNIVPSGHWRYEGVSQINGIDGTLKLNANFDSAQITYLLGDAERQQYVLNERNLLVNSVEHHDFYASAGTINMETGNYNGIASTSSSFLEDGKWIHDSASASYAGQFTDNGAATSGVVIGDGFSGSFNGNKADALK